MNKKMARLLCKFDHYSQRIVFLPYYLYQQKTEGKMEDTNIQKKGELTLLDILLTPLFYIFLPFAWVLIALFGIGFIVPYVPVWIYGKLTGIKVMCPIQHPEKYEESE